MKRTIFVVITLLLAITLQAQRRVNNRLYGGNGFRRTTAFREFQRMKDGRIPKIDIQAK